MKSILLAAIPNAAFQTAIDGDTLIQTGGTIILFVLTKLFERWKRKRKEKQEKKNIYDL